MSTLTVTNTFTGGTNAVPGLVNANFDQIEAYVNTECITKDASLAFTGVPSGPATDATTANQFTRKGYVDPYLPKNAQAFPATAGYAAAGQVLTDSTITITDPGYDIEVWGTGAVLLNPETAFDIQNTWGLVAQVGGVGVGNLRIPVIPPSQSIAVPFKRTLHTTGTNCTVRLFIARVSGTQGSIGTTYDPQFSFVDIWYRKKYT